MPKSLTSPDQHLFETTYIFHCSHLGIEATQVDDRIRDQLTGAMKRHIAATIDLEQLDSALGEKLGRRQDIGQPGIAS